MNILILGGKGFLGRNCSQAIGKQHRVWVADRIDCDDANYFKAELKDSETIKRIIVERSIECVLHFVSSIIPSSNIAQYKADVENIYLPTIDLLEFCAANNVKFVYLSSGGAVYGKQREIFNEHTKRSPISLYGLSKLNFENLIHFFHETAGLNYLIIRPSNPYGYGQNIYGKQGLVAVIIGKILNDEPIVIWGDGSAIKDYIFIDDFTYYLDALISKDIAWNHTYNIGSGCGNSVNDVLEAFRSNNIKLPRIEYIASKNSDVSRMILDCTRLQEIIPHNNKTLNDGVKIFFEQVLNAK